MRKLRLYVWEDILWDYTPGIAFALAHDVDEARDVIVNAYVPDEAFQMPDVREYRRASMMEELAGEPKVYTTPIGYAIDGGS